MFKKILKKISIQKYQTTICFDTKYHRDLFEDWMSNLGEQLFLDQLDVERENKEIPKDILMKSLTFRYPKKGYIKTKLVDY